jgi:hypothetical protein
MAAAGVTAAAAVVAAAAADATAASALGWAAVAAVVVAAVVGGVAAVVGGVAAAGAAATGAGVTTVGTGAVGSEQEEASVSPHETEQPSGLPDIADAVRRQISKRENTNEGNRIDDCCARSRLRLLRLGIGCCWGYQLRKL